MAFSGNLEAAGHKPERIDTKANVTLVKQDVGWTLTKVHLDVTASVPGMSDADFQKAAEDAKKGCPVSRLLDAEITLTAALTATESTTTSAN
jgi:osmotically inducible protein OsmC